MFVKIKKFLIHVVTFAFYPFYGYLTNRFRHVQARFQILEELLTHGDVGAGILDARARLDRIEKRLHDISNEQVADMLLIQESLSLIEERLWTAPPTHDSSPEESEGVLSFPLQARAEDLTASQATSLNWAMSHLGPAAQANLWFNPPVVLKHRERGVELDQLHERIIEFPYAMASLALIQDGGQILDVGSNESTLPISLAMLGYQVTALDQVPYPFTHPSLSVVTSDIQDWDGPEFPLDAMFCISSIEHFGLNHYEGGHHGEALDVYTLEKARTWLRPGGLLVLTVPYGLPHVTEKERVYGPDFLNQFAEGWEVLDQQLFIQTSPACWTPCDTMEEDPEWTEQTRGVLMLRARTVGAGK